MVGIVTRLWAGWSMVQILAWSRDFSLLQNVQTGFGAHWASYSVGSSCLKVVWSEVGHSFHQVLRLRMSRCVPLHPFCAFLALTGTTLTFLLNSRQYTKEVLKMLPPVSNTFEYWHFFYWQEALLCDCWFVCVCVCVYCARCLSSDGYWLFTVTAADPNAWRLGRIEEGDHETPVWNEMWSMWTSDWWCGCVRTKTVHVRTEFKYNTQDDDSLFQSLSLPYNSSKMSLHYVTVMHCATFSY